MLIARAHLVADGAVGRSPLHSAGGERVEWSPCALDAGRNPVRPPSVADFVGVERLDQPALFFHAAARDGDDGRGFTFGQFPVAFAPVGFGDVRNDLDASRENHVRPRLSVVGAESDDTPSSVVGSEVVECCDAFHRGLLTVVGLIIV